LLTHKDVEFACILLRQVEENNWSVSQLRKQVRLAQADKSATVTIESTKSHQSLSAHPQPVLVCEIYGG